MSLNEGPGTSVPLVMSHPTGAMDGGKTFVPSGAHDVRADDGEAEAPSSPVQYGYMDLAFAMQQDPTIGGVWLGNSFIVPVRGTGSGTAVRPALNEVCHRPAEVWAERAYLFNGAPVVVEHPAEGTLSSEAFSQTAVGVVIHAYWDAEEEEVICICRIIDANAAALIESGDIFDSSPCVQFAADQSDNVTDIDGVRVLFEGVPLAVDHLALLIDDGSGKRRGVWSRATQGIKTDNSDTGDNR